MARKFFYTLVGLALLGGSIYTALWYWYADTINISINEYIEDLRMNGNHLIVQDLRVSGYPLTMKVHFEGRLSSNGYVVDVPALTVESLFLPGKDITVTFKEGLTVTEPYDPELWSVDYLVLSGIIPEHMPASLTREDMALWHEQNGSILINVLSLKKNDLNIKGNGLLSLDNNLQPKGRFQAVMTGHMEFLQWLSANDYVETKEALLSATVLTGLTRTNGNGEAPFVSADMIVENQVLYIGPMRVIELPRIVWPWKEIETTPLDRLQ